MSPKKSSPQIRICEPKIEDRKKVASACTNPRNAPLKKPRITLPVSGSLVVLPSIQPTNLPLCESIFSRRIDRQAQFKSLGNRRRSTACLAVAILRQSSTHAGKCNVGQRNQARGDGQPGRHCGPSSLKKQKDRDHVDQLDQSEKSQSAKDHR